MDNFEELPFSPIDELPFSPVEEPKSTSAEILLTPEEEPKSTSAEILLTLEEEPKSTSAEILLTLEEEPKSTSAEILLTPEEEPKSTSAEILSTPEEEPKSTSAEILLTPEEESKSTSAEILKDIKTDSLIFSKKKRKNLIISIIFFIIFISFVIFYLKFYYPILNDVYIEVGTKELELKDFFRNGKIIKGSSFETDINKINLNKVSNYSINIKFNNFIRKVNLHLIDTTKPKVKFRNIKKYIDYEIDPNDFIIEKSDVSKMKVYIENIPKIKDFGRYYVDVSVSDEYGNTTKNKCILDINLINDNIELELGQKLRKEDIFYNSNNEGHLLIEEEISRINSLPVGEYKIVIPYKNDEYTVNIKIKDTTPPDLVLQDVTIYYGDKVKTKDNFIKSVKDISGEVKTTLKSEINNNIGSHDIIIEAEDINGNKIEKKCLLKVIKDTVGPVFSGLTDLYVNKNTTIDYYSGVSAYDSKDGKMNFSVDTSTLNISQYGTYYVTYISYDNSRNQTIKRRKVIVNSDSVDTNNKFNQFYNNYLAGKDVYQVVKTIRDKIAYNDNWGGNDPVWYGLTTYKGNCYVHTLLVKSALDKMNIQNVIIYTTDKSHYWNLVNVNGVWRHYDSTPGWHIIGPSTDTEKLWSSSMKGRTWNKDIFPKAE